MSYDSPSSLRTINDRSRLYHLDTVNQESILYTDITTPEDGIRQLQLNRPLSASASTLTSFSGTGERRHLARSEHIWYNRGTKVRTLIPMLLVQCELLVELHMLLSDYTRAVTRVTFDQRIRRT